MRSTEVMRYDLETVFSRVLAEVVARALGEGKIVAVVLQNPLEKPDGTSNAMEVWFGSASNQIYHMLPGQESPLVYAEDLKDLYVKVNAALAGQIVAGTVANGGAGYAVNDTFAINTADGSGFGAIGKVDAVAAGVVTAWSIVTGGQGYVTGGPLTTFKLTGAGNNALTVNVSVVTASSVPVNVLIHRQRLGGHQ